MTSQHAMSDRMGRQNTYVFVHAPNWISPERLDSTIGAVNRMEFDSEDKQQLGVVRSHVDTLADTSEHDRSRFDRPSDGKVVFWSHAPSVLVLWIDEDRDLDLTLELVEMGRVL